MAEEIHLGDVGTVFEATIEDDATPIDLASATTRQLLFTLPDGTALTKTATLTTDGSDGKMQYASESGFLSQAGLWSWQPYVAFAGLGQSWHGSIQYFRVYPNLG